jgi:hypothetical protein
MKEMMKELIFGIHDRLKKLCRAIPPRRRTAVILFVWLSFTAASLCLSISSIHRFGKDRGERLQIEHIRRLDFDLQKQREVTDSLKQLNNEPYERK